MVRLPQGVETRLLALERKQAAIGDALQTIRRQAIGVAQGVWGLESDLGRPKGPAIPPVIPPTGHPTGLCGGISLPDSIPFADPYMGVSGTLDWSTGTTWVKCVPGISWSWSGNPTVRTIALRYRFSTSGAVASFAVFWAGDVFGRPNASYGCADPMGFVEGFIGSLETCPPPTYSRLFSVNNFSPADLKALYNWSAGNDRTLTVGPVTPT